MKYIELFETFHYKMVKRLPNRVKLNNLQPGMALKWIDSNGKNTGYFSEYNIDSYKIFVTEIINGINYISAKIIPYENITVEIDRSKIKVKKPDFFKKFIRVIKKFEDIDYKANETLWVNNIIVGEIYVIDEILADKGLLPLGKITATTPDKYYVNIKTFISSNLEEHEILGIHRKFIKRRATLKEIQEFESIENSKKYNL